jgi:chemotaxis protein CheD
MIETLSVVKVGIADMNIVHYPGSIRTSGLGSCVGVVIYDERAKIAGMSHVMLPDSNLSRGKTVHLAKYADTAIKHLYQWLIDEGACHFKAKIAGGAQMFKFAHQSEAMRIGPRNVEAVKRELALLRIPIVAEDVGGSSGRTIEFDTKTNMLTIRTVNQGIKEI